MKKQVPQKPQTVKANVDKKILNSTGSANAFTNTEEPLEEAAKELSDEKLDKLLSEAEETKD